MASTIESGAAAIPGASHIRLQYLPTKAARVWRDSSLTMWAAGRANMEKTARALTIQEGWHAWRIVPHTP